MGSVHVNLGTAAAPEWLEVADRNADMTTADGATAGNSLTDYGSHYQWSSISVEPLNANKAYSACYNFREGSGAWRVPTNAEWKLYDERPSQVGKFAYFPYAGYINGSSFGTTNIISSQDIAGYYWSSDIATNQTHARQLNLSLENKSSIQSYSITYGMAVRCVKSISAP